MAVSFFIRNKNQESSTLFVRVRSRVKNYDFRLSTQMEVDVIAWEKSKKTANTLKNFRNANEELFSKLDNIEATFNSLLKSDIEITPDIANNAIYEIVYIEQIEAERKRQQEEAERIVQEQATNLNGFINQYINECEIGKRKKKGGTLNISSGTIKSYKGFKAQFDLYQTERFKVVDFDDVTIELYNDFRSFLEGRNYSPNTIARMIKIMKTICYAAENLKLIDASNIRTGFEVIYRDVDNVYLTEERIQQLYDFDLSNRPAWDKVRDVFTVGCLTGQRVSDYKRINVKMIVRLTDGHDYIKLKQEKTGNIVYIPLDERVKAILDKNGGTMPKVHDQKINDYIKNIGEHLGWTETVVIEVQKGSMEYPENKRFCDMLKTHTCRRSLATNMYKAGSSLSSIMAITGHANEQQLKTYLKLNEAEKSMLAMKDKYFTKLKIAK